MSGQFLITNERYVPPMPREEDYVPVNPPLLEGEAPYPPVTAASILKLRDHCLEGRRRAIVKQREDERNIYGDIWGSMSIASQNKVSEMEGFRQVHINLDSVRLFEFVRMTHLTNIFGGGEIMDDLNRMEQISRFEVLKQGERENIDAFKLRYDNQIKVNEGVGIAPITDSMRAMEFLYKLDSRRYKTMLERMRYDALRGHADAFPATLAQAYIMASEYPMTDRASAYERDERSHAYVTDSAYVTKARDPVKGKGSNIAERGLPEDNRKRPSSSTVKCYVCGKIGHYARDCPKRKDGDETALVTTGPSKSRTWRTDGESDDDEWEIANVTATETCFFSKYDVLLDNEASLNVFRNRDLVRNIRRSARSITMHGVENGSNGVSIELEGEFNELGTVFVSEEASANILSFAAQVDSGATMTYDSSYDRFVMKPAGSDSVYSFCRKNIRGSEGRFYCCDVRSMIGKDATTYPESVDDGEASESALVQTVEENLQFYSKKEVAKAREARELLAKMGFPSVANAIKMVESGSGFSVTAEDFRRADSIWGMDVSSLKGKTKKRSTSSPDYTLVNKSSQTMQVLSIDIMYLEKIPILIGVAHPLDYTLVSDLLTVSKDRSSRSAATVFRGIKYFRSVLASRGFTSPVIMSDGEGSIGALVEELRLLGVEIDISGAGGHVSRIERRIQVVKERVRAHMCHHLPFTLTNVGITMCAMYCVSRLNYQPSGTRVAGESSRSLFLGRTADGSRDFRCAFGDYVQCTVPNTSNNMDSRTEDCVVMLPTGNRTGSVKMLSIATGRIVTRDNFRVMPMPLSVITALNNMALKEGKSIIKQSKRHPMLTDSTPQSTKHIVSNKPSDTDPAIELRDVMEPNNGLKSNIPISLAMDDTLPTAIPEWDDDYEVHGAVVPDSAINTDTDSAIFSPPPIDDAYGILKEDTTVTEDELMEREPTYLDDELDMGDLDTEEEESAEKPDEKKKRRDLLNYFHTGNENILNKEQDADEYRALQISVKEALRTRGVVGERVILKELQQMLTKGVWSPVDRRTLSADEKCRVIRSSMFIKEKFLPTGEFEKLKARLVAGGDQQDKNLYDDLSAPTVSTCSVLTVLTIAAHEGRFTAVLDIGGAFLNANMTTGITVHMSLDATLSGLLIQLDKSYQKYMDPKGRIVVKLNKALYGCVESASLWYEDLRATMKSLGYERNPHDVCVFNARDKFGVQCTATIHVDDLFISSANPHMVDELCDGLKKRYGEITKCSGPVLNYIGMVFDLTTKGEAKVTMKGYVEDLLMCSETPGGARSPGTENLFAVRPDCAKATETEQGHFHTMVAKLLYLAKRARPDCLTAVAFLATRVSRCDKDDLEKLSRLIKYVRATKDHGLRLRIGNGGIEVKVLIDAAYGVHADGKSHTGSCVVIGEVGAVHCKSSKQQIVTKSSTEAELVGLSDSANQGIHIRNFLIAQGYKVGPITIFQDNMSCMALVERGRSAAERTRHINIRYFWVKERVDTGEAIIKHLGTKEMYANLLTKPLQGGQFVAERNALTGWTGV